RAAGRAVSPRPPRPIRPIRSPPVRAAPPDPVPRERTHPPVVRPCAAVIVVFIVNSSSGSPLVGSPQPCRIRKPHRRPARLRGPPDQGVGQRERRAVAA